ncbi:MAG: hypothetical protein Q9188_001572 [Gyalolechia gomerana]
MAVSGLESHIGASSETLNNALEDLGKDKYNVKDNADSAARRWLDAQQQQHGSPQQAGDVHPFFAFEPQLESTSTFTSQYPSLPDPDPTSGWNTIAHAHQMPSPPNSVASPPSSWPPFGYQQQPPVHNILTDIYPDTRFQYGQNTPPDDEFNNVFTSTEQPESPSNPNDHSLSASEKKRKRYSASTSSKDSPSKRSRKYGRSTDSSNGQAPSGVEEVRRSKFLERNRIAASKCRQKKKEWTQNLENRAREQAKENQSLRMMLDSLRDEMLFLKTEMLKHTTCSCEEIQVWVKSGAGSLVTSPIVKAEHSPINSAPTSRRGSFSSRGSECHIEESTSPHHQASQPTKSPELQKLEGLLMNQLVHDTSDRGIANTLQAAM